jgi:hypothetical protein
MPDKNRERYYLDAFRTAIPEVPKGEAAESEPPDFVLKSERGALGIELTVFHLPSAPGTQSYQERQSLKNRIVNIAERIHHDAGGPALYVTVFFSAHVAIRKQDTLPMARELAASILKSHVARSYREPLEIPWGERPEFVWGIQIFPSVDGRDKLWHPDAVGWVADITTQHVADVVQAKARTAPLARTRCDHLWLVIVNDIFGRAAQAEITSDALSAVYDAPFDRVFWLLPSLPPRAFELKVKPAA